MLLDFKMIVIGSNICCHYMVVGHPIKKKIIWMLGLLLVAGLKECKVNS